MESSAERCRFVNLATRFRAARLRVCAHWSRRRFSSACARTVCSCGVQTLATAPRTVATTASAHSSPGCARIANTVVTRGSEVSAGEFNAIDVILDNARSSVTRLAFRRAARAASWRAARAALQLATTRRDVDVRDASRRCNSATLSRCDASAEARALLRARRETGLSSNASAARVPASATGLRERRAGCRSD